MDSFKLFTAGVIFLVVFQAHLGESSCGGRELVLTLSLCHILYEFTMFSNLCINVRANTIYI